MRKRISWAVRLERAEANEKFTSYEKKLADSWMTCAVGEKHGFERYESWKSTKGWYESYEHKYGIEFMYAVREDDVFRAKEAYAKLQALP